MSRLSIAGANTATTALLPTTGTFYLALYVSDPGSDGVSGTEVSGGGYARQSISFTVAVGGTTTTAADATFTNLPNIPGGIYFFGIMSDPTLSTAYVCGGTVSGVPSVTAGANITFTAGNVSWNFS